MTLTFELDLDILPLDLHTKIQFCMSVRLVVRVVTHRHTQTDRHTDDVKTIRGLFLTRHLYLTRHLPQFRPLYSPLRGLHFGAV